MAIFSVQICIVVRNDHCSCISPGISQSSSRKSSDQPIRANVTFFLDNKLAELSNGDVLEFLFYPDPQFYPFAGRDFVINITKNVDVLTIEVVRFKLFTVVFSLDFPEGGLAVRNYFCGVLYYLQN